MLQGTENLYIDESGSGAIYEPPPKDYQYFNMAGVVVNDSSEAKLSHGLRKWKSKYLLNQFSTLHSVDLFEDFKTGYKKPSLSDFKKLYLAAVELVEVFLSVPYESRVFYINLHRLRNKLNLDKFISGKQNILKDVINKEYQGRFLQPISTILERFFSFHEKLIRMKNKPGYLCFESQREFDEQTIKTFHQTLITHNRTTTTYKYGKNLLGIHFDTKASLCGALELADFIAYGSTQHLRDKVNSKELTIHPTSLRILLELYLRVKKDRKIYLRDVTMDCVAELA
ncbi:hypothetical protein COU88_01165, partial [Candidatus Roizmanbacteria bacterium CG10_big_fil_rev_8_21_14_0_10_39_6]